MSRPALTAGLRGDALVAETVGTWVCELAPGTVLTAGLRLGRLRRARRWHAVVVPRSAVGRTVAEAQPGPRSVEHGSPLVVLGEAPEVVGEGADAAGDEAGLVPVSVPMTGALYRRPAPDQPAFAPAGQVVAARDVVALIEVMKTYNPIKAPEAGTVVRWLVEDGETVEPGTAILLLRPV